MAIPDFSAGRAGRKRVACFGEAPTGNDAEAFTDLGYQPLSYTEGDLTDSSKLSVADSVIFSQSADKPTKILDDLTKYAEQILNYERKQRPSRA